MGRPRKYGKLPMDTDIKIPVTSEQRAMLQKATADEPEGMAAWARSIILAAAKRKLAKNKGSNKDVT